jgi:hypothetical protein
VLRSLSAAPSYHDIGEVSFGHIVRSIGLTDRTLGMEGMIPCTFTRGKPCRSMDRTANMQSQSMSYRFGLQFVGLVGKRAASSGGGAGDAAMINRGLKGEQIESSIRRMTSARRQA